MKKIQCIFGVAVLTAMSLATETQAGLIVYQSDFTGADLASAGLVASAGAAGGSWTLDTANDRAQGVGGGNARSNLTTINSFQNDGGFTLDVTFLNTANMTRYSFGLVDAAYTISGSGDWLNNSLAGAYGIGFSTGGELENGNGDRDLLGFNNGADTATVLSDLQGDITNNATQTLSMTVTADSWSYSLNGAAATTGSHVFDTSRNYVFTSHAHRNSQSQFSNITVTAVPEPSSFALLGFGLSALLVRRRKR